MSASLPAKVPIVRASIIALGDALVVLVAIGFLWVYRATIKQALLALAAVLDGLVIGTFGRGVHPLRPVASLLRGAAHDLDTALGQLVAKTEARLALWWHYLTGQLSEAVSLIADLAETVEQRLQTFATADVPGMIRAAERRAAAQLAAARAQVLRIEHAGSIALHRATAVIDGQLGSLRDLAEGLRGRVRQLERSAVGAGAGAVVGLALARIGLGWVRCRNVSKLGRGACRLDSSLLDSLLADTLVIFSAISLVEFAEVLLDVEGPLVDAVTAGFTELRDMDG